MDTVTPTDRGTEASAQATQTTDSCRLLNLPPELRNDIYELAFTFSCESHVDVPQPMLPSKALLLTCRQIYREAADLYKASFRHFWTTSKFVVEDATRALALDHVSQLNERNIEHVKDIVVYSGEDISLTLQNGIWTDCIPHDFQSAICCD